MVHEMRLQADPFECIENGTKKIEYRLWDEKRSKLNCGDTIIFTNIDNGKQLKVVVVGIQRANTFADLKSKLMSEGLIHYNDFNPADMTKYYSKEEQYKYGVVGIIISIKNG